MQPADYFRRIPLFSDLGPEEIVDVLRIARVVSFEPGALLCARGEKGDCAFVIEDGEAAVRVVDELGKPVVIARIGPGEVVGELSLVDGHPRSADVVATRALRGYRIDRVELDALRRAMHPAAFKILRRIAITVSDRLRDVNDAIGQALTAAPAAAAKGRTSDPERGSRAGARASRELGRASLPQAEAVKAKAGVKAGVKADTKPGARPGAKPGTKPGAKPGAKAPAKAVEPNRASAATAPSAPTAGAGSLWGSMLSKLRGSAWK